MNVPESAFRVISVIGAGGKTSLCRALARHLPGRNVYLTTTRMLLPRETACAVIPREAEGRQAAMIVRRAMEASREIILTGPFDGEKCTRPGDAAFSEALCLADHTVIEADGAKGRTLKIHGEGEPVIPGETELTVYVCSAEALSLPLGEAVHRAERIGAVLGKGSEERTEIRDLVLCALAARERSRGAFLTVINRAEPENGLGIARAMEEAGLSCILLPELREYGSPDRFRFLPEEALGTLYEAFRSGIAAERKRG